MSAITATHHGNKFAHACRLHLGLHSCSRGWSDTALFYMSSLCRTRFSKSTPSMSVDLICMKTARVFVVNPTPCERTFCTMARSTKRLCWAGQRLVSVRLSPSTRCKWRTWGSPHPWLIKRIRGSVAVAASRQSFVQNLPLGCASCRNCIILCTVVSSQSVCNPKAHGLR